jgi:transposase
MRGRNESQVTMLSLVTPDQRVPREHPLLKVKALADAALAALSPTFDAMYSRVGRPSIPPERLLKATLLMAFYSVRSERLFCEQLDYNLLFRWYLDMDGVEESFDHSTFSRNRQRLHSAGRRPLPASGRLDSEATRERSSPPTSSPPHTTCSGSRSWYPRSLPLSPTLSPGYRRGRGGIGESGPTGQPAVREGSSTSC